MASTIITCKTANIYVKNYLFKHTCNDDNDIGSRKQQKSGMLMRPEVYEAEATRSRPRPRPRPSAMRPRPNATRPRPRPWPEWINNKCAY